MGGIYENWNNILTEFTIKGTGNISDCPPDVAQVVFAHNK
jgi:hypothetical protein